MQDDSHFLTVCRYVEANAVRAGLAQRAEEWAWGGLYARRHGDKPFVLSDWPVDRPREWTALVNEVIGKETLDGLRTSVNRGRPWGERAWVQRTARRLGLEFTLRNPGRPAKRKENQVGVGTPVTWSPLHGSQRAELPHWALASGPDDQPLLGIRMQDAGCGYPSLGQPPDPRPCDPVLLAPSP